MTPTQEEREKAFAKALECLRFEDFYGEFDALKDCIPVPRAHYDALLARVEKQRAELSRLVRYVADKRAEGYHDDETISILESWDLVDGYGFLYEDFASRMQQENGGGK